MSLGYVPNDAGFDMAAHGGGQDISMMNNAHMNFDMDLMDLDMDLSGAPDQTFAPMSGSMGPPPSLPNERSLPESTSSGATKQSDQPMASIGAGPLPTGFGMSAPASGSTLTEFTKRRNWSQRIIEEVKDFLHILSPDGRIMYVSPSCKMLTGYESNQITGKFMIDYIHPDDSAIFWREFNESIASGNILRFFYRFKKDDGTYMIFECDGHPHISSDAQNLAYAQDEQGQPMVVSGQCRGVFMMARPYPTKNAALLDSFLEHKMENERLLKKIEELKREEREETAEQDRLYRTHAASPRGTGPQLSAPTSSRTRDSSEGTDYQGMPPPAKPPISNVALTQQNLNSVVSAQRPDSIADKMSRYEANNTHLESIELLTGLRYRDGERSHGISTGDTSPALIRGDAGIAILVDRDRDGVKKEKKKLKVADEYVCADCGTLDSPEWRKGPKGPKTLCNACGLRWAKKEKKRGGDDSKSSHSPVTVTGAGVGGMAAQQPLPTGGLSNITMPDASSRPSEFSDAGGGGS